MGQEPQLRDLLVLRCASPATQLTLTPFPPSCSPQIYGALTKSSNFDVHGVIAENEVRLFTPTACPVVVEWESIEGLAGRFPGLRTRAPEAHNLQPAPKENVAEPRVPLLPPNPTCLQKVHDLQVNAEQFDKKTELSFKYLQVRLTLLLRLLLR